MKITPSILLGPSLVLALWRSNTTIIVAALGAIGYACSAGVTPPCAIAAGAAIILAAMSGINAGENSGTTGANTVKRSDLPTVAHYLPNDAEHDYLNTGALEVGTWHTVQFGKVTLRASKHPDGFNILRAFIGSTGGKLSKRADANDIEDISAQFGDRNWPVSNQWGQDELNNMATTVLSAENLDGVQLCSTISDETDADTFDMSWIFETENKPYTEIPPLCGA